MRDVEKRGLTIVSTAMPYKDPRSLILEMNQKDIICPLHTSTRPYLCISIGKAGKSCSLTSEDTAKLALVPSRSPCDGFKCSTMQSCTMNPSPSAFLLGRGFQSFKHPLWVCYWRKPYSWCLSCILEFYNLHSSFLWVYRIQQGTCQNERYILSGNVFVSA